MGIRLTAPEVALRRLRDTIYRLGQVPQRVSQIAAPKLTGLLREQFDGGKDPYGRPWRELRPATIATGRTPPPLTDTERLRDGTRVKPGRNKGLSLIAGAAYGAFAQVGFRVGRTRVAPRRIFPEFGLPASWTLVLRNAARDAAKEAVRA